MISPATSRARAGNGRPASSLSLSTRRMRFLADSSVDAGPEADSLGKGEAALLFSLADASPRLPKWTPVSPLALFPTRWHIWGL